MKNETIKAALEYLERGWSVIPLCPPDCSKDKVPWHWKDGKCEAPGKAPLIKWKSFQEKPPSEAQVSDWWDKFPWANVGIATGKVSDIVVVDFDSKEAIEAIKELGDIPSCLQVRTGGGGTHAYFKHPNVELKNFVGKLKDVHPKLAKMDLRCTGGQVAAPPSLHRSGNQYKWLTDYDTFMNVNGNLPELPTWFLDLLKKAEGPKGKKQQAKGDNWVITLLTGVSEGERNNACAKLAGHYLGKKLSVAEVETILLDWNEKNSPPMNDCEIVTVIKSIANAENKSAPEQTPQGENDELSAGDIALKFLHTYFIKDEIFTLRYWRQDWWEWNDKCYDELSEYDLRAQIARFIDDETQKKVSRSFISNVYEAITGRCLVPASALPPVWVDNSLKVKNTGHILIFKNGWLDLETFLKGKNVELQPHTPKLFTQIALPYDFNPDAECPKWLTYLNYNLEGDANRIAILQEFTGYCFIWDTELHKFLMLEGESRTGKSTFTNIITTLWGEKNVSHVPLEMFGQRFALSSTLGKLANVVSEIGEMDSVAEGQLKAFTSGDAMQFEYKFKKAIETKPTARLILATNNRPRFLDRSNAIWERLILIPWNIVIPKEKRISGLSKQIIQEELSGIFCWAMAGLVRLQKQRKFTESEVVQNAIDEYKADTNPAKVFLQDNYQSDQKGEVKVIDIYNSYKEFCSDYNYRALGEANFGKEIRRLFPESKKERQQEMGARYYVYSGIAQIL